MFRGLLPSMIGSFVGVTVVALLNGYVDLSIFKKESITEIVMKTPVVNLNDTFRTVIRQNKEEGLAEIVEISKTSDKEDNWLYSSCSETWYETGTKDEKLSSTLYTFYWNQIIVRCDSMGDYHNHNEVGWERLSEGYLAFNALPSYADIVAIVLRSRSFRKEHPEGKYWAGVVSPIGVVEFSLTELGYDYFRDQSPQNIKYWAVGMQMIVNEATVHNNSDLEDVVIGCESLKRGGYLECQFTPTNKIIR